MELGKVFVAEGKSIRIQAKGNTNRCSVCAEWNGWSEL